MKAPFRIIALSIAFGFALAQKSPANLVQDGEFTSVTYNGTEPSGITTLFGEFGSGYSGTTPVPNLTVANWTTAGYNFVYAPGTADSGTNASGANSGQPNEAPGQFTTSSGFGNTYLAGSNNGGVSVITAPPTGGNFVAADGAYEINAISQTITGLTVGQTYALKFYWGAGQQQSFSGATTESWTVTLGSASNTTATYSLPTNSFSGWMQQTFYYTATSTSETLSFLANGTPTGEPPFTLLADVDLEVVPDFSNWMVFAGFGVTCIIFEVLRRRRRQPEFASLA